MVNPSLLPAIRETIKQNEIGNETPYRLSYARLGKSGASFGIMQGDTNVSALARTTLRNALASARLPQATIDRCLAAVSKPLPQGSPLLPADAKAVDAALSAPSGRLLVDRMDDELLKTVLAGLEECLAAAATRRFAIEPRALLYIAPWINMSGPPTLLSSWFAGAPALGLPPPPGPGITEQDVTLYLQATVYFQAHPKNFVHLTECVAEGAKLLPPEEHPGALSMHFGTRLAAASHGPFGAGDGPNVKTLEEQLKEDEVVFTAAAGPHGGGDDPST